VDHPLELRPLVEVAADVVVPDALTEVGKLLQRIGAHLKVLLTATRPLLSYQGGPPTERRALRRRCDARRAPPQTAAGTRTATASAIDGASRRMRRCPSPSLRTRRAPGQRPASAAPSANGISRSPAPCRTRSGVVIAGASSTGPMPS